jgi:hypothetical protein
MADHRPIQGELQTQLMAALWRLESGTRTTDSPAYKLAQEFLAGGARQLGSPWDRRPAHAPSPTPSTRTTSTSSRAPADPDRSLGVEVGDALGRAEARPRPIR